MATGTLIRKPESSGTYSYSSQPRVVEQKQKYREDVGRPANIMFDRRIVRGNTYALHTLPASAQPDPMEVQRQQELRRRAVAYRRAREQMRVRSPPPVEGRRHTEVQTELYLEEITDRIEEADVHTQTDAFLDRPPTPLFVPAKTGLDACTQIMEGDLFNFDLEVRPILEVLVGKTMEQALLEVAEEEELAALREQQRIFEENRNAEFVETQRLEEQERRRQEEKDRRKRQQHEALVKEKETAEKIAARAFAQSYLSDLVPAVFSNLSENGFFYDPVERDLETTFMPWLLTEAGKILDSKLVARAVLDAIIKDVVRRKLGIPTPEPSRPSTPAEKKARVTESKGEESSEQQAPASESKDKEDLEPEKNIEDKEEDTQNGTEQPPASEQPASTEEPREDHSEKLAVTDEPKVDEKDRPASSDGPEADEGDQPPVTDGSKADEEEQPPTDVPGADEADQPPVSDEPKDEQPVGNEDRKPDSEEAVTEESKREESEPVPAEPPEADTSKAGEQPGAADETAPDEDKTVVEAGEGDEQQDLPAQDEDTTSQSEETKEQ